MRVRFSLPAPREGPSQHPLCNAAVLLRDSSPRSGHYAGHWVPAPPSGPSSPSFSVSLDALGYDGFAYVAVGARRRRSTDPSGAKEPLERGEQHRIIQQSVHPNQLHRQPPQILRQKSLPERLLISYRATRMVLTPSSARVRTILPCQRLLQPSTPLASLGRSNYPGRCDRLFSESRKR
jgi:hypothetical protein